MDRLRNLARRFIGMIDISDECQLPSIQREMELLDLLEDPVQAAKALAQLRSDPSRLVEIRFDILELVNSKDRSLRLSGLILLGDVLRFMGEQEYELHEILAARAMGTLLREVNNSMDPSMSKEALYCIAHSRIVDLRRARTLFSEGLEKGSQDIKLISLFGLFRLGVEVPCALRIVEGAFDSNPTSLRMNPLRVIAFRGPYFQRLFPKILPLAAKNGPIRSDAAEALISLLEPGHEDWVKPCISELCSSDPAAKRILCHALRRLHASGKVAGEALLEILDSKHPGLVMSATRAFNECCGVNDSTELIGRIGPLKNGKTYQVLRVQTSSFAEEPFCGKKTGEDLVVALWEKAFGEIPTLYVRRALYDEDERAAQLYIAVCEGTREIVGTLVTEDAHDSNAFRAYLGTLAVAKGHRGQGLAWPLLDAVGNDLYNTFGYSTFSIGLKHSTFRGWPDRVENFLGPYVIGAEEVVWGEGDPVRVLEVKL